MGAASAVDLSEVSNTEDSNLISDNASSLLDETKLEVSSEDSISETINVNSHDDDLVSNSAADSLKVGAENSYGQVQSSNTTVGSDKIIDASSGNDVLSASNGNDSFLAATAKVSTKLTVSDTHYGKSNTYFKVTLKDDSGKAIKNEKISFIIKGKTYSAVTNSNGIALVKTIALPIGTYSFAVKYAGSSKYKNAYLSDKVKVLSSVTGSDVKKYYGYVSVYSVKYWKNNEALANTTVKLTVHGVTYTKTTDAKGYAYLNVNLAPGTYDITTTNPYSMEKSSNKVISKKDGSVLEHKDSTYLVPNKKYTYSVVLKSKHNTILQGKTVYFTFNNKQVAVKTDADGRATFTVPVLSKGTYTISFKYNGDHLFGGTSSSAKIYVQDPTSKVQSSDVKLTWGDKGKYSVTVKDKNGKVVPSVLVKFTLNGKTYSEKTNSKGVATLTLPTLKPGQSTVSYQVSGNGNQYYNTGSNKITVSKQTAQLSAGNLIMEYKDGSSYKVTAKYSNGKPLKGVSVKFTIHGVTYTKQTDDKGVATFNIGLVVGYYPTTAVLDNKLYQSSTVSKYVIVNGTKFVGKDLTVTAGKSATYSVKLLDYKENPMKNTNVVFTLDGKTYNAKTDSSGIAKLNLGVLSKGDHTIKYANGKFSGTSKIHVLNTVTLSQIISASKTVKSYIEKNHKLPTSVTVGSTTVTTAQYVYLASKAIVNLKAGKTSAISIEEVANPKKPDTAYSAGNLYDYLSVAKSVIKTIDSTGVMPNSASSDLGTVGYNALTYAFARVVAFYGTEDVMPNYVVIKSLSGDSSSATGTTNTITNLAPYLAATTNCQVTNAKIKELAAKLTKGLTSDYDKAKAIYNYVRDYISYSFYYDTKHGAVGTLNAKSGNCVDQAHLSIALYRAAKLPARYVHGTCRFSSGSTYGHVWAQVLVNNKWVVSDTTSSRNSFGNIVNWNTNSYSLHGYYSSLSF
ncbi:MAG: hypothetical protein E7Z77_06945 [Methanobrevibacter sp.]|uniref:Ig-like domain-containing protein n=1 Tax=Methanobrevibacter sp. TaxID=66852 RepID=UPI0025F1E28A|nr:Ig-like domain-containing protein [Methanobrevibacter sp.]MBE6509136.1 hypothetical protein [Methanobrevibacter sp.]